MSPDCRLIAFGFDDGSIGLWAASGYAVQRDTKSEFPTRIRTMRGHGGRVRSLAFSPDGQRLISGSEDRTIKVWDVAHPRGGR